MKKIISFIFSVWMILGLAACGANGQDTSTAPNVTESREIQNMLQS